MVFRRSEGPENVRDNIRENLERLQREEEERQEDDNLDLLDNLPVSPSDADIDRMNRQIEMNASRLIDNNAAILIMESYHELVRWVIALRNESALQAKREARMLVELRRHRVLLKALLVWPAAVKRVFWILLSAFLVLMASRVWEMVMLDLKH